MNQTLATNEAINTAVTNLIEHNITVIVVNNSADAVEKVLSLIPKGAEVMQMTSVTLDESGINKALADNNYKLLHAQLLTMDRATQKKEMKVIRSVPDYAIGSVQAVTEDGSLVFASATGSQLGAYAYGALKNIFVAGTNKVVKNLDEALKRIYEYVLPLETERMKKVHGPQSGSSVNKLLVINKEFEPGRITLILVKESLGF